MTGESRASRREPVPPDTTIAFELVLRFPASREEAIQMETERLLTGGSRASRDEALLSRSADPADVAAVRSAAERAGLTVDSVDAASRRVSVSGPARVVNKLFGVTLVTCTDGSRTWRDYDGTVDVPASLDGVSAVLGLSTRSAAATR